MAVCAVSVVGAATLSEMLSQPPVIAPEAKQEEPAKPAGFSVPESKQSGCWEVTLTDAVLTAHWLSACASVDVKMGAHGWREGVLRLPGAAGEVPNTARAQAYTEFSEDLALAGKGALLYLPSSASGAGYYVAAWAEPASAEDLDVDVETSEPAPMEATRGYQVGRYGAPPASVLTPTGRIYLRAEYSPRRIERPEALLDEAAEPVAPEEPPAPASPTTT